jgi:hypothetical protein
LHRTNWSSSDRITLHFDRISQNRVISEHNVAKMAPIQLMAMHNSGIRCEESLPQLQKSLREQKSNGDLSAFLDTCHKGNVLISKRIFHFLQIAAYGKKCEKFPHRFRECRSGTTLSTTDSGNFRAIPY